MRRCRLRTYLESAKSVPDVSHSQRKLPLLLASITHAPFPRWVAYKGQSSDISGNERRRLVSTEHFVRITPVMSIKIILETKNMMNVHTSERRKETTMYKTDKYALESAMSANTMLFTDRGIMTAEDLYKGSLRPALVDEDGNDIDEYEIHYLGVHTLYRVIIENGMHTDCTYAHQLKSRDGSTGKTVMKKVEDLSHGDYVLVKRNEPVTTSHKKKLAEEEKNIDSLTRFSKDVMTMSSKQVRQAFDYLFSYSDNVKIELGGDNRIGLYCVNPSNDAARRMQLMLLFHFGVRSEVFCETLSMCENEIAILDSRTSLIERVLKTTKGFPLSYDQVHGMLELVYSTPGANDFQRICDISGIGRHDIYGIETADNFMADGFVNNGMLRAFTGLDS